VGVSAGFVDRAGARLSQRLEAGGFDAAMLAALLGEPTLGPMRARSRSYADRS